MMPCDNVSNDAKQKCLQKTNSPGGQWTLAQKQQGPQQTIVKNAWIQWQNVIDVTKTETGTLMKIDDENCLQQLSPGKLKATQKIENPPTTRKSTVIHGHGKVTPEVACKKVQPIDTSTKNGKKELKF